MFFVTLRSIKHAADLETKLFFFAELLMKIKIVARENIQ